MRELGADKYKSYGALNDHSEAELRALISQMTEMGYLYQTQERYSVLKLGDISPLRDENTHVIMRTYEEKEADKKKKPQKSVRKRSTDAQQVTIYLKPCGNFVWKLQKRKPCLHISCSVIRR